MQLAARLSEEAEDNVVDRRSNVSAWQDPRLWVSVLALLLTFCTVIGGFLASQLYSIHNTMTTLLVNTTAVATRHTTEIEQLKADVRELRATIKQDETTQTAYNNQQAVLLTQINTKLTMTLERKR